MGVTDSWEDESANLYFDPQGAKSWDIRITTHDRRACLPRLMS